MAISLAFARRPIGKCTRRRSYAPGQHGQATARRRKASEYSKQLVAALKVEGKDIVRDAGHWMRDDKGKLTRAFQHICWDGCMFPNAVMMQPKTWNDILAAMIGVRNAHGWRQ